MLILLEGLGHARKAALANALATRLDCAVVRKASPAGDWASEFVAPLAGYGAGLNLVLDGWHWSEMVWPTVFDRPGLMTLREFRYADSVLARLGAVAVVADGSADEAWQDAVDDVEPITQLPDAESRFANAVRMFARLADVTTLPVYGYDPHADEADVVASTLGAAHDAQRTAAFNASSALERVLEIGSSR